MRIAFLDCYAGISGDMFLGALVDAGVPLEALAQTAEALGVGARLEAHKVLRGGLTGTKLDVLTEEKLAAKAAHIHPPAHEHKHEPAHSHPHEHAHPHKHEHAPEPEAAHSHEYPHEHAHAPEEHAHAPHRSLATILGIIAAAPLSDSVKEKSSRAFRLLGEAEAAIHGVDVEKIHFHEVGAVDTIVDIVCAAVGAELLGVERWVASPLNVGSGTVKCQHGILPVPAPATLKLLGQAPVYAAGVPMERVTPTGAAILLMLGVEYVALPPMSVQATGYGAGGRDAAGLPNLVRLLVGETSEPESSEAIAVIETVIDDSTPQLLAYVSELLLAAGAWDVYRAPVQMKKGRTGVQLTVLSSPERAAAMREIVFRETTTIGLRWRVENKVALKREFATVATPWGEVAMKIARWPSGEIANATPEYEDCRLLAEQHKVPLKRVMQAASEAFSRSQGPVAPEREA